MAEELTTELWKRVSPVLDELLELDPACRQDFLSRMRADDPDLLWWIRTLLQAANEAGDFMERSPFPGARRRLLEIFADAGPGMPATACTHQERQIEPEDIGSNEPNAPGRNEK